jgi:hypothetical protein
MKLVRLLVKDVLDSRINQHLEAVNAGRVRDIN